MRIIRTSDSRFEEVFRQIAGRGRVFDEDLWKGTYGIVRDVAEGRRALFAIEQYGRYRLGRAVRRLPAEIDARIPPSREWIPPPGADRSR